MNNKAETTDSEKIELPSWDLTDFYKSKDDEELQKDIDILSQLSEHFEKYFKDKIASLDGDQLAKTINKYEEIEELIGKIGSFSFLTYVTDMPANGEFFQNITEKLNDVSSKILFFTLELNNISDSDIAEKKLSSKDLQKFAPWLRDIRSFRPYQLSTELEKILLEKSISGSSAWVRLFDESLADLRFTFQNEELNCAEIFNKMSSHNAEERKEAAKSIGKTLGKNIKLFTFITNILAKDKSINDSWRGFNSPISSRNLSNFIEDEVVDSLISSVKESYEDTSHRYYKIKAKWLGKEQLEYWDRNAPLPDEPDEYIEWDEAVNMVLKAYGSFSPKLAELGANFFANNWIDVAPRDGKDSGAFAHPTIPSVHPYLMLNYQGKIRDVMTLAHELGHGVHQLLSSKKGVLMADTPLTLAETASVFGEQLTFREYLNNETDNKKKKIIIANKVEDMLNTVVRQVAFCEFERLIHNERLKGELSTEQISEIWMRVQKESLGEAIKFEDEYKYYWSYIPHFVHSPFYVYSYAFGDCLVNALYARYTEGMDNFEEEYFKMLEAGGTLHHKELLAPFDLDASKADFWKKGLGVISGFIDELE